VNWLSQFPGGLFFDLIFAEGAFAQASERPSKLPCVSLLQHWRDAGRSHKALRIARRHLTERPGTYAIWLFAAETCALWHQDYHEAERIIRRLCRSSAFTADQKSFAVSSLSDWEAAAGRTFEAADLLPDVEATKPPNPVAEANNLRQHGKLRRARRLLRRALRKDPENLGAALQLARIYAQDQNRPGRAVQLFDWLARRPFTPTPFLDFAHRSLEEWRRQSERPPTAWSRLFRWLTAGRGASVPEPAREDEAAKAAARQVAADEFCRVFESLLEQGYLGSAMAQMEAHLEANPGDFESLLLLLGAWLDKFDSLNKADEVFKRIQSNPAFTQEQKNRASERFQEWERQRWKGGGSNPQIVLRMAAGGNAGQPPIGAD
jgi:tetratricopeptide (TPR) repeat protein